MTDKVKEQDGWVVTLLIAILEKIFSWITNDGLDLLSPENQMFRSYSGYATIEEAHMYQAIARIKYRT